MAKLGKKQRAVLEWAEESFDLDGNYVPAYVGVDLPNSVSDFFWTEREFQRFLEQLDKRGWVRIEKRFFVRITEAGRAILTAALQENAK